MEGSLDVIEGIRGSSVQMKSDASESVCAMFERQLDRTPDAVALICEGRSLTFRGLDAEVNRLARYLRAQYGVGPESLVALLLGRSERMLISMLGVLKAGGAYLPLSPDYPPKRVHYILSDANPEILLTERLYAPLISSFPRQLCWDDPLPPWAEERADRLPELPSSNDLAYVMYTSGSTGNPKGVMSEHGNLSNFIQWCREEYRDSSFDIVYAGTPYGFDLSNIELYFPLAIGRSIRLLPSSQVMGLYLRRDRRVLMNTVPSLVQEMLKTDHILDNVSVLNLGGEPVPPSLARRLRAYPHLEIRNMYGPTETTSTAINYRMHGAASLEVLIGKPISNTVVYILDEDLQQVPVGTKGEICIGGRGVSRGYLNRPELTRERFIDDPFNSGARLYRTGDYGTYLPNGNIRYLGRNDNQVKLHGFRVELDEIGRQLEHHSSVKEAVVGIKKTDAGDKLMAVCSLSNHVTADVLAAFLEESLPPYMLPNEIVFLEAFPLMPTGKIDRLALFTGGCT